MEGNRKLMITSIISNGLLYGTIIDLSGNNDNSYIILINISIGVFFWIFKLKIINNKYKYKIALADIIGIFIAMFVLLSEFSIIVDIIWTLIMIIIACIYNKFVHKGILT